MKVYGVDGQREMDDQLARTKNTMFDLAATVAELRIKVRELEAENERHRKANLVRAVTNPLWDEHEGWVADYIGREDFDAIPWRIAQNLTGVSLELDAERAKVGDLEAENADLRHQLDRMRPTLDRMGYVFTEAAELGLPDGVKGIDGTWQIPT